MLQVWDRAKMNKTTWLYSKENLQLEYVRKKLQLESTGQHIQYYSTEDQQTETAKNGSTTYGIGV